MVGVVEFGAAAELSVELAPGEAAAVRQELEDELGDIGIGGGGAAGALGAGGGSALTDGAGDLASLQGETVDLLEDILDELEAGGVGGGGGGGGLTILPTGGAGGAAKKGGGLIKKLGAAALASPAGLIGLASGAAAVGTQLPDPTGRRENAFEGGVFTFGIQPDNLDPFSQGGLDITGLLSGSGPPTDQELPGNITREQIRRNRRQGTTPFTTPQSTGPSRQNRAAQQRDQQASPTINVDVTVEQTRQALEQAVRDAKRQAAREVAQEVNQNIPGTTSRTGL